MNTHGDEVGIDPEKFLAYIQGPFKRDLKLMIQTKKEILELREGKCSCRWCPTRLFSKFKD